MNTLDIYNKIKKDIISYDIFLGVFSRDQLPSTRLLRFPCTFIINTDKQTEPGEHWLAFYYDKNKNATFFDPCGLSPKVYGLEAYLKNTSSNWSFNSKRIQSFFSVLCGEICIFFLYFVSRNFSLNFILNLFSNNYEQNEKVILNFLNFNFI